MSVSLIVPITLQALCVGEKDVQGGTTTTAEFAQVAADFSRLPYLDADGERVNAGPNLSHVALPPLFSEAEEPLQAGIHLHWTLPEALAHGIGGEEGPLQPRQAPNRWLVLRTACNVAAPANPVTALAAWVVESDLLWDGGETEGPNSLSRAFPLAKPPAADAAPNRAVRTLGRAFPYESWSEGGGGEYSAPHTMLGYGELAFAAAYPHAPNCFGFWDTLEDLDPKQFPPASTSISYTVAGWYADAAADPLTEVVPAGATQKEALAALAAELEWTFADDGNGSVPSATVCGGLLTGLEWNRSNSYLARPSTKPIEVAVGNTGAEALAALLAAKNPDLPGLEEVVNALDLGLLDQMEEPDGPARLEAAAHQATLGHSDGGTLWALKPALGKMGTSHPDGLGAMLDELNAVQAQTDALAARLECEQSQLFADWHKYMAAAYPPEEGLPDAAPSADEALTYIGATLIPGFESTLTELAETVAGLALAKKLLEIECGEEWELSPKAAPRYWTPNEPVLLLEGADLESPYRPQTAESSDEHGNLRCRLATTMVGEMTIDSSTTVTAAALPQLPASPNSSYAAELAALTGETFFLDWHRAPVLAAASGGGVSWEEVENAQRGYPTEKTIVFDGQHPAPLGLLRWEQPWIPLLLQWELEYYPLEEPGPYPPGFIADGFELDPNGVELVEDKAPSQLPSPQGCQGQALLSRSVPAALGTQVAAYLKERPDDPHAASLERVAKELESQPLMAQALGGLHPALCMRMQTLQLPVRDPLAASPPKPAREGFSNETMPAAVGEQNTLAPIPESSFNPLRAGLARVTNLWIVDVFGQKRELQPKPSEVIRAKSMIPAWDDPAEPYVELPPRFAQPSKLSFRLLAASKEEAETNSDPATSPIFGWVLFNHVEESLAIYNAGGAALGSLNVRGPFWSGAPGNATTYGKEAREALAGANPYLRELVLGICEGPDPVDFLTDLLAAIDAACATIEPQSSDQNQALSVLVGRPLALARAGLGLELRGMAALDQGWQAFEEAVGARAPMGERADAGVPAVEVPVRLGSAADTEDGLVGWFLEGAYGTFYTTAKGVDDRHGVVPPGPDALTLAAGATAPTVVSMLVDPRAAVHGATGLLPIKQIQLPPELAAPALRAIAPTFLGAPVLSSAAQLSLPLPREPGHEWSWVEAGASGWVEGPIAVGGASAADLSPQRLSEGWLKLVEES